MKVTAQEEFDTIYITSSEICRELNITRTSVLFGRRRGLLPNPIRVNGAHILIWRRSDVDEYLNAWKISLQARRKELI